MTKCKVLTGSAVKGLKHYAANNVMTGHVVIVSGVLLWTCLAVENGFLLY